MKKVTLLTATAFFCFSSFAQIKKGSVYLGGDVSLTNIKFERSSMPSSPNVPGNGTVKGIVISPAIGIAIKDNLIAGADITYQNNKTENYYSAPGTTESKGAGAGVFIRRYFPVASQFYFFGQARVGYANRNFEQISTSGLATYDTEEKTWNMLGGLYPGLSYNVTKSFYLEMGLNNLLQIGYEKTDRTETQTYNSTTTKSSLTQKGFFIQSSLSNSTSLNVGVRFIFPKK